MKSSRLFQPFVLIVCGYLYEKIRLSNNSLTIIMEPGSPKVTSLNRTGFGTLLLYYVPVHYVLDLPDWANEHLLDWADLYLLL